MRTRSIVLLIAVLFMVPCAVIAGTDDIQYTGNKFYYIGAPKNPTTLYNPTSQDPNASGWAPGFIAPVSYPPTNLLVSAGQDIVLARRNLNLDNQVKYYSVYFEYKGSINPSNVIVGAGSLDGTQSDTTTVHKVIGDGVCWITVKIDPQPDWEWIRFTATDDDTLTRVAWHSHCYPLEYHYSMPIPTLTQWGIWVLVLLLGATAGWILWKRRASTFA